MAKLVPDWFPRIPLPITPILPPPNTPSIPDQLKCPPGQHRDLATGACVDNATAPVNETGTRREIPDEGFVAPTPPPRIQVPPKVPGPVPTPSGPSPADVWRGPVQQPVPRTARLPSTAAALTRLGALFWVLGTLVFSPYFYPRPQSRPAGPPRRRGRARADTPDEFPWGRDPFGRYNPMPRNPVAGVLIPQPGQRTTPRSTPRVSLPQWPEPVPKRPESLPRTRTPVRTVPAPRPAIFDPLPGPGYDPYTYTPPAPAPRSPARPFPRTAPADLPFPIGWPVTLPRGVPRVRPGTPGRPLTRQPPPPSSVRPLTPQLPRTTSPLTPINPGLSPLPQYLGQPQKANPCTEQRTERRRRQRECKKFTTKTIRVCAD